MTNKTLTWRSPRTGLAFATALLIGSNLALAEDKVATNAPPKWDVTAAAGLTITRGNSETLLATLSLDAKRKWEQNELLFGAAGGYGEDDVKKNTDFINGFGQYNRLFGERFYAGLRVDAGYDGIAELAYRVRITPLAGYYLIKEAKTKLSVEAGPSAVFEKYWNRSEDTYLGIRFGERFEHQLTGTTKVWQSLDYVPQIDKWTEKYVVTGEIGIDTAITKQWSLRVVLQDVYDSLPAPGRKNNDFRLVAGTAYKF